MKKVIFIIGLSVLFLASCNDDNKTTKTTNDYNPKTSEITNEPTSNNSTYEQITSNETLETSSDTKPSQGNINNDGEYTEETDEGWEYLG